MSPYKARNSCTDLLGNTKAFDKVRHQELFEDLDKLDLYRKDVH